MNRLNNLAYIINCLTAEDERLSAMPLPSSLDDRQRLMRALLNIREPKPVSEDFLKAQDAELQLQKEDKGVVVFADIANNRLENGRKRASSTFALYLWQGDITRLQVDAIVNAANSQMLGCFRPLHNCIDNAIHSAAGIELRLECSRIMQRLGREAYAGEAIITKGYNLPAKYVIHTVGPIIADGMPTRGQEVQLANCYRHSLELANEKQLKSIAFCCISTGVFMFPQRRAAEIALASVETWLDAHSESSVKTVVFNVFKDSDYAIYKSLC